MIKLNSTTREQMSGFSFCNDIAFNFLAGFYLKEVKKILLRSLG